MPCYNNSNEGRRRIMKTMEETIDQNLLPLIAIWNILPTLCPCLNIIECSAPHLLTECLSCPTIPHDWRFMETIATIITADHCHCKRGNFIMAANGSYYFATPDACMHESIIFLRVWSEKISPTNGVGIEVLHVHEPYVHSNNM